MWSTPDRWDPRETRRSASVIPTKTTCMISARTHARMYTHGDPKLVCSRIFIHPSARGSRRCFSHAYVSRSHVVSPLATPACNNLNSHAARRTYASRRERIARVSRKNSVCLWSQALDRSRGFANILIPRAVSPCKSEAKCFEDRIMARRKRSKCASTFTTLVTLQQCQSNQVKYTLYHDIVLSIVSTMIEIVQRSWKKELNYCNRIDWIVQKCNLLILPPIRDLETMFIYWKKNSNFKIYLFE